MPTTNLKDIRKQYPQYDDLSDQQLADALHKRFYSDMPREQFNERIGLSGGQGGGPTIKVGDREIPVAEYQSMPEEERQAVRDRITEANPDMSGAVRSSALDPAVQGLTFGWGDEMRGAAQGAMAAAQGGDFGETYRRETDRARASLDRERRVNPVGSVAAEVAGALPTAAAAGGQLAGRGASLLTRGLTGAGVGAGQGAAYGAGAAEGDIADRAGNAALGAGIGGTIGGAAPMIGNKVQQMGRNFRQNRALNQAARTAPSADEIKSASSALFDQADSANISVTRDAFQRLNKNIENAVGKFRPNAQLDPKAMGVLQVFQQVQDDVAAQGSNVLPDLKDLHMLRQAAQRAAISTEGRDAAIANQVVNSIDDFVKGLKPADIAGGGDPRAATTALMQGISTWSRASKAGIIEEAIYKAQNQASGLENGLRVQFRRILNNPKMRNKFNDAEIKAIQDVVQGTTAANTMKLLGKFGFGSGNASNMLGGSIGATLGGAAGAPMGPLGSAAGAALAAGGATGARRASEALTNRAAQRALGAAASPNLRVIPRVDRTRPGLLEQGVRGSALPSAGMAVRR